MIPQAKVGLQSKNYWTGGALRILELSALAHVHSRVRSLSDSTASRWIQRYEGSGIEPSSTCSHNSPSLRTFFSGLYEFQMLKFISRRPSAMWFARNQFDGVILEYHGYVVSLE